MLTSRHRRRFLAVAASLDGHPFVEALADAFLDAPLAWGPEIPGNDASRLDAHDRSLMLIGASRALNADRATHEHLDRLDVTLMVSVLDGWLPKLGLLGERVRERMRDRGPVAVNAHLIQELSQSHDGMQVLVAGGVLRENLFVLDELVAEAVLLGPSGVPVLVAKSHDLTRRMLDALRPSGERLGWTTIAALWLSIANQLGGGTQDLTATQAYSDQEFELPDDFVMAD